MAIYVISGVEFARRYLIRNFGLKFGDVDKAYDIFKLTSVTRINDSTSLPFEVFILLFFVYDLNNCIICF